MKQAKVQEDIIFNIKTEFWKRTLNSQLNENKEQEEMLYNLMGDVIEILKTQIEFKGSLR